mmetsp:Transcript_11375/g.13754  ORF Transcript_11375/g.13754 Transcript_11375/m.13754 type:complete len:105 (-) Transcript_11375:366-680(-)
MRMILTLSNCSSVKNATISKKTKRCKDIMHKRSTCLNSDELQLQQYGTVDEFCIFSRKTYAIFLEPSNYVMLSVTCAFILLPLCFDSIAMDLMMAVLFRWNSLQ